MAALLATITLGALSSLALAGNHDGDHDRDDSYSHHRGYVYDRVPYGYPAGPAYSLAGYDGGSGYRFGYEDGSYQSRKDMWENKSFNPNPRGPFRHEDRGYSRAYGPRNLYREQYGYGYRAGYEANYRGRWGGRGY
jgi:hypothetical protein